MSNLSTAKIVSVWEEYWNRSPCDRAVGLLTAVSTELNDDEILALPIGRRDQLLLQFRAAIFGNRISGLLSCPSCTAHTELACHVDDLVMDPPPLGYLPIEIGSQRFQYRLPNSFDLLSLQAQRPQDPREFLVQACLNDAGRQLPLTGDFIDQVSMAMSQHDPQASLSFEVVCSDCQHRWEQTFDIVEFLWQEISVWAQRLIGEVHALASAYGWTESEVFSLSPARRQIYLNMLAS